MLAVTLDFMEKHTRTRRSPSLLHTAHYFIFYIFLLFEWFCLDNSLEIANIPHGSERSTGLFVDERGST